MELEISRQIMVSMPFRFSLEILLPICGRATITMSNAKAASISTNFTVGRYLDMWGISCLSNSGSPNFLSFALLLLQPIRRTSTSAGITHNSQRNAGSSNLNMVIFILFL